MSYVQGVDRLLADEGRTVVDRLLADEATVVDRLLADEKSVCRRQPRADAFRIYLNNVESVWCQTNKKQ